ncbi:hypothetical protein PRVXT_000947 [Proteinivorax tanatarense]|uniref:Double zinc ribbon n=1 Tax=Proteinivorax tanatarense TaxID=1260629 RepID=A0AAU7VNN0_9FIRM
MPVILCIVMGVFMYLLFLIIGGIGSDDISKQTIYCKNCGEHIVGDSCSICEQAEVSECECCSKSIKKSWRYCPFCGEVKENKR